MLLGHRSPVLTAVPSSPEKPFVNYSKPSHIKFSILSAKLLLGASEPPEDLQVDKVTNKSVTLSWQPPAFTGNCPIVKYVVEKKKKGASSFTPCKETDKPPCTIDDDLEEDEEVEFRVRAVNEAGKSQPSNPLKVKIREPEGLITLEQKFRTNKLRKFRSAPPKISSSLGMKDQRLQAGQILKLFVEFKGYPPPTATWFCDGKEVKPNERVVMEVKDNVASMVFPSVSKTEKGRWQVQLRNEGGMADAMCTVFVYGNNPSNFKSLFKVTKNENSLERQTVKCYNFLN